MNTNIPPARAALKARGVGYCPTAEAAPRGVVLAEPHNGHAALSTAGRATLSMHAGRERVCVNMQVHAHVRAPVCVQLYVCILVCVRVCVRVCARARLSGRATVRMRGMHLPAQMCVCV